ncbi:MAG: peptidoglycan DD-metalloendopeptidase family protein [Patescibacteria group bacterium]
MKRSHVSRAQSRAFVLVALLFLGALFIYSLASAETAKELNQRIDQKNLEIEKLEEEIKVYQSQLDSLGKQKNSLNVSLSELDVTRKKLSADISITQRKIDRTNLEISGLSSQIVSKEDLIANNLEALAGDIRQTAELERQSLVEMLLSDTDMTVVWNDFDNRQAVREKIKTAIGELRTTKVELEDTREESITLKNELIALRAKLSDQKKIVEENVKEKNRLLLQTKSSEVTYQKILVDQLAKKAAFERELRDYESRLKFILDPSALPEPGVLSWPLDSIYVTQEFGAKTGPHRTYASGHSGADFRARTPLPAYAMADGVVKGVGDTDLACSGVSFGKWVFVEFNNGLSATYGHLSLIKVQEGQRVKRGETIAYTGGTGRVTGPHLHVSLYVASAVKVDTVPSLSCPGRILKQPIAPTGAYLDPMYYLPPLRS